MRLNDIIRNHQEQSAAEHSSDQNPFQIRWQISSIFLRSGQHRQAPEEENRVHILKREDQILPGEWDVAGEATCFQQFTGILETAREGLC